MFPAGHIGVAVFLGRFLRLNLIFVAVGAILPDIIDKPLPYFFGVGYTWFIGHSLFTALGFFIAFVIIGKRHTGASIAFGCLLHLFTEFSFHLPWFYPLVNYDFPFRTAVFSGYFKSSLGFRGDVFGLGLLVITKKYYHLFPNLRSIIFDLTKKP